LPWRRSGTGAPAGHGFGFLLLLENGLTCELTIIVLLAELRAGFYKKPA